MKKFFANAALGLVSVLVAYALLEVGVRWYLHDKYDKARFPMVVTHQTRAERPGDERLAWMVPSASVLYWKVDENSRVVFKTEYYSNNLGLISRRDQSVARTGKEFRIAVVGDSFTAALQMPVPWTDTLADLLNADQQLRERVGVSAFSVYNLGQPAGGFKDFKNLARVAKRLSPDLVVVNYIEADFPRCNGCFDEPQELSAEPAPEPVSGNIPITLPGEKDVALLSMTCERGPVSFDNPTCRHSFSLDAPASLVEDPQKLALLKRTIVGEFLKGQLFTTWRPYALLMALGQPVSLTDLRRPQPKGEQKPREVKSLSRDEQLAQAADMIGEARGAFPRLLVTRHPLYEDLGGNGNRAMTDALMALDPKISVVDMRERMPADTPQPERYAWYCLPHDGHMSQAGGDVYARAMYGLIRQQLLEEPGTK